MSDAQTYTSDFMRFIAGQEFKEQHPVTFTFSSAQHDTMAQAKLTHDLLHAYAKKVNSKIKVQLVQNHDRSATLTIELDEKSIKQNDKPAQLKKWLTNFRDDFKIFYGSEPFPQELTNKFIATLRLESKTSHYPLMILPRERTLVLAFLDQKARDATAERLWIPADQRLTITTNNMTLNHFIMTLIPEGLTAAQYVQSMIERLEPPKPTIPEGYVADTEYRYPEDVARSHPELKLSVLKH